MAQAQLEAALAGRIELGREGSVNRLGFGAMRITGPGIWGEPRDPEEARRVLRRAAELGVEFIDTAHSYGPEVSERLIGEALYPYPDDLVIATKSSLQRSGPDTWLPDARPESIRSDCERSLTLLRRERIDLLQLHRVHPRSPRLYRFWTETISVIAPARSSSSTLTFETPIMSTLPSTRRAAITPSDSSIGTLFADAGVRARPSGRGSGSDSGAGRYRLAPTAVAGHVADPPAPRGRQGRKAIPSRSQTASTSSAVT